MDETMTRVYVFDNSNRAHELVNAFDVKKGIQLNSNETTIAPNNGRFFNGTDWTDKLVNIYSYDGDGYLVAGPIKIPENAPLNANETTLAPGDDMYKPKFVSGQWVESFVPDAQSDSTARQMISLLGQRVAQATADNAQLKQDNTQLKQMVSTLGQTVAQLKAQSTN